MGNKLGWIIAGSIMLVLVVAICWVIFLPPHSDPTADTTKEGALDLKTVEVPVTAVLGSEPKGGGNAADDYKKAVAMVTDPATMELVGKVEIAVTAAASPDAATKKEPIPDDGLAVMRKIAAAVAEGASKGEMSYPYATVEVTYKIPEAYYMSQVSQSLSILAYYYQFVEKKPAEAEKVLHDRFAMGYHMTRDRV